MPFQANQIGCYLLIKPAVRVNDRSIGSFERQAPGDFLQVGKDRSNMRPGKVGWIVDVAVCTSDNIELGDNAEKRLRLYVGDSVLKLQGSSRGLDLRLAGNVVADFSIRRFRTCTVQNAPL
ncbi:hypothetical protein X742_24800 [Mesorhizobium sp. LNHC232B00]|nr:hypothetical protein X742_24800 [Mesorhizobium sp. LNHC232B00]